MNDFWQIVLIVSIISLASCGIIVNISVYRQLRSDYFDTITIWTYIPSCSSDGDFKFLLSQNHGDIDPFSLNKDSYYRLEHVDNFRFKIDTKHVARMICKYLQENINNAIVYLDSDTLVVVEYGKPQ